jgi:hypothetical protein
MSGEFNPTHKDLSNLESKILELKETKAELIKRKIALQNSLSMMSAEYKECEMNSPRWKEIKSTRDNLKFEFQKIELEIKKTSDEIVYKRSLKLEVEHHLRGKPQQQSHVAVNDLAVKKLTVLHDKYNEFAKDKTRRSSMRVMAAEIRDDISKVIKLVE